MQAHPEHDVARLKKQLEEARVAVFGCELDFRKTAEKLTRLKKEKAHFEAFLQIVEAQSTDSKRRICSAKENLLTAAATAAKKKAATSTASFDAAKFAQAAEAYCRHVARAQLRISKQAAAAAGGGRGDSSERSVHRLQPRKVPAEEEEKEEIREAETAAQGAGQTRPGLRPSSLGTIAWPDFQQLTASTTA